MRNRKQGSLKKRTNLCARKKTKRKDNLTMS